ncbi:hypothetical protein PFISCL1PPCAC_1653, partial [Pristionchus fissidentatus]
ISTSSSLNRRLSMSLYECLGDQPGNPISYAESEAQSAKKLSSKKRKEKKKSSRDDPKPKGEEKEEDGKVDISPPEDSKTRKSENDKSQKTKSPKIKSPEIKSPEIKIPEKVIKNSNWAADSSQPKSEMKSEDKSSSVKKDMPSSEQTSNNDSLLSEPKPIVHPSKTPKSAKRPSKGSKKKRKKRTKGSVDSVDKPHYNPDQLLTRGPPPNQPIKILPLWMGIALLAFTIACFVSAGALSVYLFKMDD